jgi:hypothetical protein
VATDTATRHSGLCLDGFRRLDHLETGVRSNAKRSPGSHRVRVHVPGGKIRSTYDIVRSWAIIGVISGSGGALLAVLEARGHW